ncbi:MAG: hypothetical protein Q8R82_21625 [Hyphomonadaceae bacterium]|nr:hypothetical protein [Hyphomonadaceae bacterium]
MIGKTKSPLGKMKEEDYPRYTPPPVVLPDDDRSVILDLRSFAAMVWEEITMVFGPSIYLVRLATSERPFFRQTLDWLRNLELFVRRFIAVTALSMTLPPVKPAKASSRPSSAQPAEAPAFRRCSGHWADVQSWDVRFRIMPRGPSEPGPSREGLPRTPVVQTPMLYGLARRIEALRRVLSYHEAYARRFARSLDRMRARAPRANDRVLLGVKPWKFNPYMASKGQHAVREMMPLLTGLCERAVARWQGLDPRPG